MIDALPRIVQAMDLLRASAHVVHYEALVSNPQKELQSICQFLNISFVPEMSNYGSGGLPEVVPGRPRERLQAQRSQRGLHRRLARSNPRPPGLEDTQRLSGVVRTGDDRTDGVLSSRASIDSGRAPSEPAWSRHDHSSALHHEVKSRPRSLPLLRPASSARLGPSPRDRWDRAPGLQAAAK